MRLKFTGEYTNKRTTITYLGCTFEGYEPREVPVDVAELLAGHPEFEPCDDETQEDELAALRAKYAEVMGKKPFHGWDAETLIEKMG